MSAPGAAGGARALLAFYRPYARAKRRWLLAGLAAALGVVLARLVLPLPLALVFRPWLAGEHAPGSGASPALAAGLAFLALYALLGLLDLVSRVAFARFAIESVGAVRADVAARAAAGGDTGEALARLVGDAARLKDGLKGFLIHVATNGMLFVGVIVALLWIDARMAAIFGAALLLVLAVTARAGLVILLRARILRRREGRIAQRIWLAAREDGRAPEAVARVGPSEGDDNEGPEASLTKAQGRTTWSVHGILGVALVACLWSAPATPGSELVFLAAYAAMLYHPVVRLSRQGTRLGKIAACAGRIAEAASAPERPQPKQQLAPLERELVLEALELSGRARVRVGPLDLVLRAGERVALLGGTGSGKSSLFEALARRSKRCGGRILWDGGDVSKLGTRARAERVAWLSERVGPADAGDEGGAWRSASARRGELLSALLERPRDVLLLDAPLLGLAPREARARLAEIVARAGGALLVVALSEPVGLELFERVVLLRAGRVAFDGTPAELGAGEPALPESAAS